MNKIEYNNSIFFVRYNPLIEKLQKFYEEHQIKLIFKSVKSYFHFNEYIFSVEEGSFLNIYGLGRELSEELKNTVLITMQNDNEVIFQIIHKKRLRYDFLDAIENKLFQTSQDTILPIVLGNHNGIVVTDLMKEGHLLITGQKGSGKSNFIHNLILSLMYHHSPETLKLVLMDPRVIELSIYKDIPHLLTPVIVDAKKALSALIWCENEVERRHILLSQHQVHNIVQYNEKVEEKDRLPYIVIVIDGLADFMYLHGKKAELCLSQLLQTAKTAGIHLVITTGIMIPQVITNLIEVNMLNRIVLTNCNFTNTSHIFDEAFLSGDGDALFLSNSRANALRIQTPFVNYDTIVDIIDRLSEQGKPRYVEFPQIDLSKLATTDSELERDPLIEKALAYIIEIGSPSISSLQRKFNISFHRASGMIEYLEYKGILSAPECGKRKILKTTII